MCFAHTFKYKYLILYFKNRRCKNMEITSIKDLDVEAILNILSDRATSLEALGKSEHDVNPIQMLKSDIENMKDIIQKEKIESAREYFALY
jgi:hypothetical protein